MAAPYSAELGLGSGFGNRTSWLTDTPARFLAVLVIPVVVAGAVVAAIKPPNPATLLTPSGTGALVVTLGSAATQVSGYDFSTDSPVEITLITAASSASESLTTSTGAFRFAPATPPSPGDRIIAHDGTSTAVIEIPALSVIATSTSITGTATPGTTVMLSLDQPGLGMVEALLNVPPSGTWSWSPTIKVTESSNIYVATEADGGSTVEVNLTGDEAMGGFGLD